MSRLSLRPGYAVSYRHSKAYPWMPATVQSVVKDTVWIKLHADIEGLISLDLTKDEDMDCLGPPF